MQIVINIDSRFPRWLKRGLLYGGVPAFVLGTALVYGDVTVTKFNKGDPLSSTTMNANLKALQDGVNAASPAGAIMAYGGLLDGNPGTLADGGASGTHLPPTGWLFCNGDRVSRTQYAALFAALGIAHGGGDGVSTFNLPDYRGRFLRGVDGAAGNDPDAVGRTAASPGGNTGNAVGSIERGATALPIAPFSTSTSGAHTHYLAAGTDGAVVSGHMYVPAATGESWALGPAGFGAGYTASAGDHSHVLSGGDKETRPVNAAANFIIRY